jgi:hypothetical protein
MKMTTFTVLCLRITFWWPSTSIHSLHVFLFTLRTRPSGKPPSIAVLEQLPCPAKRMALMSPPSVAGDDSDQVLFLYVSSQFVKIWLFPQFVHSTASRRVGLTVRVLGYLTLPHIEGWIGGLLDYTV